MKYSFTRGHEVNLNNWSEINRELQRTMEATVRGEYTEEELVDYCHQAVRDGVPLPKDPNMVMIRGMTGVSNSSPVTVAERR